MYVIQVKIEGEWIDASEHTREEDATRQIGLFIAAGHVEEDVRQKPE